MRLMHSTERTTLVGINPALLRICEAAWDRKVDRERREALVDRCEHGWAYEFSPMPCGCVDRRNEGGQITRARHAGLDEATIESVRQGCYSDAQLSRLIDDA